MRSFKAEVEHTAASIKGNVSIVVKTTDETIEINSKKKVPAASTIKIPILMEAFRQVEIGELDFDEKVDIPSHKKVGGDGVLKLLNNSLSLSILDLMKLMIVVSDNTASNLVIDRLGFSNINNLCEKLDCTDTRLNRYFMDFEAIKAGVDNATSASDMVQFFSEIKESQLLSRKSCQSIYNILKEQQFASGLPAYQKDGDLEIANKPGMLPGVQHDVGIFTYNSETVYAAVLLSELDDEEAGRRVIADMGRSIMEFIKKKRIKNT
ncbi:serine hydrolase [Halobacillus sp. BBL2006]|uniref:serine hydrolase n=1 Tax=Halobacillus sp. BBL2006 TaxID=1543706 RepID=UPI00054400B7|nr:serine hydrolase [Halobacillus sp. BBL2006]KHE72961.1 hypothetical protein LD39_01845 [Halobacillus sp. BBL2006]